MSDDLEKLILSAGDLPVMPLVASKVMQLVEDERVTAAELAKVVSSDPTVAARVLKISNSALYSRQRQIQTLTGAITLLGFNTIRSIVVTASIKDVFKPYGLIEKMLWEHSIGAALAAHIIAKEMRDINNEEAFLAGLLHDIGKLVMLNIDSKKFQMTMEHCYNEDICFVDAEKSLYPYTHAQLGGCVLKKWNLPEVQVDAVTFHHELYLIDPDNHKLQCISAIVNLADLFCRKLGIGARIPQENISLVDSEAACLLNLDDIQLATMLDNFQENHAIETSYFF